MDDSASRGGVAVLFPAAGTGSRLGGERKQFRVLGGKSLLVRTLSVFQAHPEVTHLIVAAPRDAVDSLRVDLQNEHLDRLLAVVAGGPSRQESVHLALQMVPDSVSVVLVHDAVRPFVRPAEISAVIDAARTHGAAALAIPVSDTVRRVDAAQFGPTVPREGLYRMQTPQAFERSLLLRAHETAPDRDATDDVELVQQLGTGVFLVPGSDTNIKITTPSDWIVARALWDAGIGLGEGISTR